MTFKRKGWRTAEEEKEKNVIEEGAHRKSGHGEMNLLMSIGVRGGKVAGNE